MTKNNYWLTITNEANWEIIKKNEIYGFNEGHKKFLDEIKVGDYLVMYVIRKKFGGLFRVASKNITNGVKFKDGVYPYKIKLKTVFIPKYSLDVTNDIVDKISIFKNSIRWGTILFGRSIKRITKEDYEYIKRQMQKVK
jgi:predicted RNA-binding protein